MGLLHNSFMENVLTLNKQQLDLLQDFTHYPVLQIFEKPHNPSQVAKSLNMPANALHYRVKKLAEAGLLKLVSQHGRVRSYQSVANHFRVHRDLISTARESLGFSKDLFDKVAKGFRKAEEDYIDQGFNKKDAEYIHFGLDDTGLQAMGKYEPCLGVFEVPLTQEQYQRLTRELLKLAREVSKEDVKKTAKPCTVTIVAFAKSSTFPNLS
jgi:Helix-turn-helix domain